jgi:hypothetical protein
MPPKMQCGLTTKKAWNRQVLGRENDMLVYLKRLLSVTNFFIFFTFIHKARFDRCVVLLQQQRWGSAAATFAAKRWSLVDGFGDA